MANERDLHIATGLPLSLINYPSYLVLYVTDRCDMKCSFCFNKPERDIKNSEPSLEQLGTLAQSTGKLFELLISGGEPFLRKDLGEILISFIRKAAPSIIAIPTHGGHPLRIERVLNMVFDYAPEQRLHLNLSIDAIGEEHDQIRGSKGLIERIIETRKRVGKIAEKHKNLFIGINTVIGDFNRDNLRPLVQWCQENLQPDVHHIGLDRNVMISAPVPEVLAEYQRIEDALIDIGGKPHGMEGALYQAGCEHLVDSIPFKKPALGCSAGRRLITITSQGDVYPCEAFWLNPEDYTRFDQTKMGNLNDFAWNLSRLMATPESKDIAKKISAGQCGCLWECALFASVLFTPRGWGKILSCRLPEK